MFDFDIILNAFVTLFVTIDPPGLAPIFLALTAGMNRTERYSVALRGVVIAFGVLVAFALFGIVVLDTMGITIHAFRVAGGLLLFYIAFEMVFEKRQERHEKSSQTAITKDQIANIAAFPLAIPLIAGPGAIAAVILQMSSHNGDVAAQGIVILRSFSRRGSSRRTGSHLSRLGPPGSRAPSCSSSWWWWGCP